MEATEAQGLRSLERENFELKKLLAEAHLDISGLKAAFGVKRQPHKQNEQAYNVYLRLTSCQNEELVAW